MTDFSSAYVPRMPRGLLHREVHSLHLLLHPEKPRWAVTNRLGWEIVQLCDGTNSLGLIISNLAERYGMPYLRVEADVSKFLWSLEQARLSGPDEEGDESTSSPVKIRTIFLHLTNRCNLRCVHCYAHDDVALGEELKSQRIYLLIDELAKADGRTITLSGGEPLLRRDWFDIVEYASERLEVNLNTNGTLIDATVAELLSRARPTIQVSIDGPCPEIHDAIRGPGSFEAAVAGIRQLLARGLSDKLVICMTLMRKNITSAPAMIDFVRELGIPKLRFIPLHSQGRARSSWSTLDASPKDYLKWFNHVYHRDLTGRPPSPDILGGLPGFLVYVPSEEEELWCDIGKKVVVDAHGNVYPCSLLMGEEFRLGTVNQMSLEEVEASSKLRELTAACLSRTDTIEKCTTCIWKNFCRASCPALAFLEKGTLYATDDFCGIRKKLYQDVIFKTARNRRDNSPTSVAHAR